MQTMQLDKNEAINLCQSFYKALNSASQGDATPMETIWSHSDDVVFFQLSGQIATGWENVKKAWKKYSDSRLSVHIRAEEMQVILSGDTAIIYNYEIGSHLPGEQENYEEKVRSINIFRNENGKWKMILHTVDKLPIRNK